MSGRGRSQQGGSNVGPAGVDQATLIEDLKQEAAYFGSHLSERIWFYRITDQKVLVEIAKIAAANDPGMSEYIKNFGIKDPKELIEIAKIAASTERNNVSQHIHKYGIRSQAARIEVAMIDAENGSIGHFIRNYKITNQKALVQIAKIAAAQESCLAHHIKEYGIDDEASRIEVAMISAAKNGEETSRYIARFDITDQQALIQIAKAAAAQDGRGTSCFIKKYGIHEEASRIEVAMIAAARDGGGTSEWIRNYGIKNKQALFEIAKVALSWCCYGTSENIGQYSFRDERTRIRLAMVAAAQNGHATGVNIRKYGISNQNALIEIAKIAAAQSEFGIGRTIENFDIKDEGIRIEIARTAAARSGWCTSRNIKSYNIDDESARKDIFRIAVLQDLAAGAYVELFKLSADDKHRILNEAHLVYGATIRAERTWSPEVNARFDGLLAFAERATYCRVALDMEFCIKCSCDWDSLTNRQRLRVLVSELIESSPYFDSSLLDYEAEIEAEELCRKAFAVSVLAWEHADINRYGSRSQASLALFSGYEDLPNVKGLSGNTVRELWGTLTTAYELLREPPARVIPVSFRNTKLALEVIMLAATLKGLGGEIPKYSEHFVSDQELKTAREHLATLIGVKLSEELQIESIKPGAIGELLSHWGGDLAPFFVLAARYRGDEDATWQEELPVLREIARHVLSDTFHDWRYRNDDEQLSMLSSRQLAAWRRNPSELVLERVNAEVPTGTVAERMRATFETNLLRHIPQEVAEKAILLRYSGEEIKRFSDLPDADFARQIKSLEQAVALIAAALQRGSDHEVTAVIKLVNGVKGTLIKDLAAADVIKKQLSEDFKSLTALTKLQRGAVGQGYYVFSTITDDPKLLLMTGDLVQAGSCQNFRSGSHIQTLPAYVIDGNIKLALSYVIKDKVLENVYERLGGGKVSMVFDAPKQELVFRAKRKSERVPLGYAMRREVLRLGTSWEGNAVLLRERPYLQVHAIESKIADRLTELVTVFMKKAQLSNAEGGDEYPASRNPAGVYTDAGGGIEEGIYSI
jgi:hypothetical protein